MTKRREKIIERVVAGIMLVGVIITITGFSMMSVVGNSSDLPVEVDPYYFWKSVSGWGVMILAAPLFIGLIYFLTCLTFGVDILKDI